MVRERHQRVSRVGGGGRRYEGRPAWQTHKPQRIFSKVIAHDPSLHVVDEKSSTGQYDVIRPSSYTASIILALWKFCGGNVTVMRSLFRDELPFAILMIQSLPGVPYQEPYYRKSCLRSRLLGMVGIRLDLGTAMQEKISIDDGEHTNDTTSEGSSHVARYQKAEESHCSQPRRPEQPR